MAISIHAPRVGSDICRFKTCSLSAIFQSTLPVWGATSNVKKCTFCGGISIHAPRVGSDTPESTTFRPSPISIHAPRVGSDSMAILSACGGRISIHAPRVGSDRNLADILAHSLCISIHAPRVGSDARPRSGRKVRGYFNPRSPCGERQYLTGQPWHPVKISIHAPRVGSDRRSSATPRVCCRHFNPRSPCGERLSFRRSPPSHKYFNPRSPCGERPYVDVMVDNMQGFQSTLPVWGAT